MFFLRSIDCPLPNKRWHLAKDVLVQQNVERVRREKDNRQGVRENLLHADSLFDEVEFAESLSLLHHSGRWLLCCSQPLEAWIPTKIRQAYGAIIVQDETISLVEKWSKKTLMDEIVDKASGLVDSGHPLCSRFESSKTRM